MSRVILTNPFKNSSGVLTAGTNPRVEFYRVNTYATAAAVTATTVLAVAERAAFANGDSVYVGTNVSVNITAGGGNTGAGTLTLDSAISWSNNDSVIRKDAGGADLYATVYDDPDFATSVSQPITANSDNEVRLHIKPGRYGVRWSNSDGDTLDLENDWTVAEVDWIQVQPEHDSPTAGIQEAIDVLAVRQTRVGGTVYIPEGIYTITAQITVSARVTLLGAGARSTVIIAGATFPTSTPLIRLGTGAGIIFNARLENLGVDGNNITGSTCVYTNEIQEESGIFNCVLLNYRSYGANFDTGVGAITEVSQSEMIGSVSGATAGLRLAGSGAITKVSHCTINGDVASPHTHGIHVVSQQITATAVHFEQTTNGIFFDTLATGSVIGATGNASTTNVINIAATNGGGVFLIDINVGGSTNGVLDALTSRTIPRSVAFYMLSNTGGAGAGKFVITSDGTDPGYWNLITAVGCTLQTLTDQSTTPSVAGGDVIHASNTGATSITDFTDGKEGQRITILFTNGNTTLVDSSDLNLLGSADVTPLSGDTYTFTYDGANWFERSRSRTSSLIATLADDATPSIALSDNWLTGGTTQLTDLDDGYTGKIVHILAEHNITVSDNANFVLAGGDGGGAADFSMTSTDTLTLIQKADTFWYELARSVN